MTMKIIQITYSKYTQTITYHSGRFILHNYPNNGIVMLSHTKHS